MTTRELHDLLVTGMARAEADAIALEAAKDPTLLNALFKAAQSGRSPRSQKAAYVIRHVSERFPGVFQGKTDQLHRNFKLANHDGILRDTLKCFLNIGDPDLLDDLADKCMGWLVMAKLDAAVKYYSAMILEGVCHRWPELKGEFAWVLESQIGLVTDNFDRFARKILKEL